MKLKVENINKPESIAICKPTGHLREIVDYYLLRHIITPVGSSIYKYMPCKHTSSIDFFIGDAYHTINLSNGENEPFFRCTVRGPRTYTKYAINIHGNFKCFSVKFKPTGIYQLLKIPMDIFCNQALDAMQIKPGIFNDITNRLLACDDIYSCIKVVEPFFISMLSDSYHESKIVSGLSEFILNKSHSEPLNSVYKQFPLTPRQLERKFIREIGVPPKQYSTLIRFEKLINHKICHPHIKWTELTYVYDYFDQMHMIRDFQRFLHINPNKFEATYFAF